jgi:signal transduction histidine kinase
LYVFIKKRDVSFLTKVIFSVLLLPILLLAFTPYTLSSFDVIACNAIENPLIIGYSYLLTTIIFIGIILFSFNEYRRAHREEKRKIILVSAGIFFFLMSFSVATYIPSILNLFESSADTFAAEMYGFFGMTVFMGFLTYLIVRYKAFNIQLLAAQALVIGLVVLIGSEFFFITTYTNRILVGVTLFLAVCFGWMLIRSVKREVEQRERIEKLAKDLEAANAHLKELDKMKSEFLSIASHQLRAPITSIRGYAANILDGSYGAVPAHLNQPLHIIQESARLMVNSIEDYLNISRIEQGRMKYEKSDFDLGKLASQVVDELAPVAAAKKLALTYAGPEKAMVNADIGKVKQVITNLIDNAIKYTPEGKIEAIVEKKDGKAVFMTKDTGIGIPADEIGQLFSKFTRARGANDVNTSGTGLGLYVAKQLTEGNGGTIHIESEGKGKGSRFIVELPAKA